MSLGATPLLPLLHSHALFCSFTRHVLLNFLLPSTSPNSSFILHLFNLLCYLLGIFVNLVFHLTEGVLPASILMLNPSAESLFFFISTINLYFSASQVDFHTCNIFLFSSECISYSYSMIFILITKLISLRAGSFDDYIWCSLSCFFFLNN